MVLGSSAWTQLTLNSRAVDGVAMAMAAGLALAAVLAWSRQ